MTGNLAWKILLIDDDEDDYLLTREMVSKTNAHAVELSWVSTYDEGVAHLTNGYSYDAVLIDYDLGVKTGLDLMRQVIPQGCPYPLILLTGRGSYEVDVEAMQAGASLYLTKDEVNPLLLERGIRYAIEMKRNEQALRNRSGRLQLLSDLAAQLLRNMHPVELLDQVSQRLTKLVDVDVFVHYQRSEDGTYLNLAAIGGYPEEVRAQLKRLEFGQAVCGTVAKTCRPMIVQDVQNSKDELTRLIRRLGIAAYACHPLMVNGQLFGTLSFGSRTRSHLDSESIDLLRTVCDLIAVAFERREAERASQHRKAKKWLRAATSEKGVPSAYS
jgi:DNA-binding response OmpR family regulator